MPGGVAAPPLPGRALGSADSGRAEGSGRSRQAARAAAPGLTHRGAGTQFATGDRSHRRPGPLRPQPAFLPPRPPPPPAPHSRPRVLPTAPEPPAPSASQVSVAAARPGLHGRDDRAGPGARRGAWAGGGGGGPSSLTPARPRDCGRGAPAPGSRRSPRRHRRQSARGGSPAGSPCLRAASRVRPRPSEPGRPASPLPGALVHFWVKGTRNVQQVRAVIIIFRRVRSARRAGTRCGGRLRGESPRPAPAAGSFVWPVTGPGRRVGDAGQRPPGCRSLLDGSLEAWGLGLPRVCGPVTSLQPLQESQRDGRAGWQGYLDVYLFLYVR